MADKNKLIDKDNLVIVALKLEHILWRFVTDESNPALLAFELGAVLPELQKILGVKHG